jgi:hypothetical protein
MIESPRRHHRRPTRLGQAAARRSTGVVVRALPSQRKEEPMVDHDDSRKQDASLAEELRAHHAVMMADLDRLSTTLVEAAASGDDTADAKRALEEWVRDVLVPHAEEEEATTYRAAGELTSGELLIRSMLAEHDLIRMTARHVAEADDPVAAGAFARALFETFDSHQRKENDIVLPLLVDADSVSLTDVMAGAHHHDHGDVPSVQRDP